MKGIKYILFDWGGTIGISGCRQHFVSRGKGMLPGAEEALRLLHRQKVGLGILSNTEFTDRQMAQGLKKSGLWRLFPVQVYSSDPGVCRKPCRPIFQGAWDLIKKRHPKLRRDQTLYVGNNYFHDVVPAWNFGFKTALVSNGENDFIYRLAGIAGVQDMLIQSLAELLSSSVTSTSPV